MYCPKANDDLIMAVEKIMRLHVGYKNRIDREDLVLEVTDCINSKVADRKVRNALAELPVIWQDGYFIPQTEREARKYIASMRSRQAAIGQRLRILDDHFRRGTERVRQLELVEV
ncbi:MAG: hypothetical protein SVT56_03785 [Chloroflexota bacterium]|nr:hypothetical protein [Chloroflexota bacterium]